MTNDDGRISFGPKDSDSIPPTWASGMLTYIKYAHPAVFGEALTYTLDIEMPKPRTRAPSKKKTTDTGAGDTGTPAPPLTVANGAHARAS